jgi:hypothetical protein
MDQRLNAVISTAALLAGAGALLYLGVRLPAPDAAPSEAAADSVRSANEHCIEAAQLVHDVRWAAACMHLAEQDEARHAACVDQAVSIENPSLSKAHCDRTFGQIDGSADCTLPNERAGSLLTLLTAAEQRCAVDPRAATP